MIRTLFLVLGCCCLVFSSGCGERLPAGFPKVYPITVIVKDGETPLPNIQVSFIPKQPTENSPGVSTAFAAGATKENGVAPITTVQGPYAKKGIAEGDYIVTVEDIISIPSDISPEEKLKMSLEESRKLAQEEERKRAEFQRKIPTLLSTWSGIEAESSPLRFTASKGKNELVIDIAQYK